MERAEKTGETLDREERNWGNRQRSDRDRVKGQEGDTGREGKRRMGEDIVEKDSGRD